MGGASGGACLGGARSGAGLEEGLVGGAGAGLVHMRGPGGARGGACSPKLKLPSRGVKHVGYRPGLGVLCDTRLMA